MWNQLDTNKVVGGLFPNDGDGNAWGDPVNGVPPAFKAAGYKTIDPGRYQNLTDDFSAQITAFKNAGAEIVTGVVLPPDFTTFWNQANQQGFKPKAVSVGKAILFPESVEVLGEAGNNLSSEVWWSPNHPFKSSLTGQSSGELATAFEKAAGRQWTQPIGFIHSLLRGRARRDQARRGPEGPAGASSPPSSRPTSTRSSARCTGTAPTCRPSPPRTSAKTPLVSGQWRRKDDGKFDLVIVDNQHAPNIPVGGKMEPIG